MLVPAVYLCNKTNRNDEHHHDTTNKGDYSIDGEGGHIAHVEEAGYGTNSHRHYQPRKRSNIMTRRLVIAVEGK